MLCSGSARTSHVLGHSRSIGFTFQQSGELKLDKSKLAAALNSDADGVRKLFVGDSGAKGVFTDLSARLGVQNSAGGALRSTRRATDFINAGSANISALAPRSNDLAYIQNMMSAIKGTDTVSTRLNVRA